MTENQRPEQDAADRRTRQIQQVVRECYRRRAEGESIRDESVIKRANELGVAMVMTGVRHFKH